LNVAFSPDGGFVAYSPDRYAIRVRDLREGTLLYTFHTSFTGAVNTLAFAPDGGVLASGHYDGVIRLWDLRTGGEMLAFPTGAVVQSLAYSPDGSLLATGGSFEDHQVRLWSAGSGALLRSLEGHTSAVTRLLFSPSGDYLVSASHDGTILLWGIRP
jgi:WD40 repeat protein